MGFLERWFRSGFRADGAGYVYLRRGQEVRFTAEEVEDFVAEWRRVWLNPMLWGGWLLIGVGGPWWLAASGFPPGAWVLGLLAAGFMVVTLMPSLLRPCEAADAKLPEEEAISPLSPEALRRNAILNGVVFAVIALRPILEGFDDLMGINLLLMWSGIFLLALIDWGRAKLGKAPKRHEWWRLAILGVSFGGIVVATALHPDRTDFDMALAGVIGLGWLIMLAMAGWQRLAGGSPNAGAV